MHLVKHLTSNVSDIIKNTDLVYHLIRIQGRIKTIWAHQCVYMQQEEVELLPWSEGLKSDF